MRVLIADDHAIVRRGVREILEESALGLAVDEAASAGETLIAVRNKIYDIILLDISFPDGSGLDVLSQVHAFNPKHSCPAAQYVPGKTVRPARLAPGRLRLPVQREHIQRAG